MTLLRIFFTLPKTVTFRISDDEQQLTLNHVPWIRRTASILTNEAVIFYEVKLIGPNLDIDPMVG